MFVFLLLAFVLTASDCVQQDASKNILVLIENFWARDTHSTFLSWLSDHGYHVTVKPADDPSLALLAFGEYLYGHVLLLAPSVNEFGGALSVNEFVKFVDNGGNVLVTGSLDLGSAIRSLASEFGIDFDEEAVVIDHQNYDTGDDGTHTRLAVPSENVINAPVLVGKDLKKPVLFKGISISADFDNPLLIDVLHASATAYSHNPSKKVSEYPNTVGTNTKLITALQARNNARVVFVGSLDFFSDDFFRSSVENVLKRSRSPVSGNQELSENLMRWMLGERGMLRVVSVEHSRVGEQIPPQQYTINDEVQFTIKIETKNERNMWVPFEVDDVQLELVRIDPFIRQTIKYHNGQYKTVFKLPDVYGVFKFVVDYHRTGYTSIFNVTQVPIRPYTHRQYERFIDNAFPYYMSSFSMMIGVVAFSFLFLYHKGEKTEKSKKE